MGIKKAGPLLTLLALIRHVIEPSSRCCKALLPLVLGWTKKLVNKELDLNTTGYPTPSTPREAGNLLACILVERHVVVEVAPQYNRAASRRIM